jgi:hypothetical protein
MRTIEIAFLVLAAASALPAAAQENCTWRDPGKPPRLYVEDRTAFFRTYYPAEWANCVTASGGKRIEIEWLAGNDPSAPPVQTDREIVRGSKDSEPRRLSVLLAPNHVCEERRPSRGPGKIVPTGKPGREEVSELVPVRVRIKAAGPLAPLAYTSQPVEVPCPLCLSPQNNWNLQRAGGGTDLYLSIDSGRTWFECASRGATLVLRIFTGESREAVTSAIAPDLELAGLEKEFALKGDKYVLSKPLPTARLCAKNARFWAFELWGKGELMQIGGGGRAVHEAKCK